MEAMKAAQTADVDDQIKAVIMMRRAWKRTGLFLTFLILITYAVSAQVPTADFTCTPTGFWSRTISCSDQSAGNPTGWAWFFGDEKYSEPWILMNASSGWTPRSGHTVVSLPDNSIVLVGGLTYNDQDGVFYNLADVWRSTDNGTTWVLQNTTSPEWESRWGHNSIVLPNGNIVIIGGVTDLRSSVGTITFWNDTWMSTDKGRTWTRMTSSAGWTSRQDMSSIALSDGSIVLFGGWDSSLEPKNDSWISYDSGASWTQLNPSSGWSERGMSGSVALSDDTIILTGGGYGIRREHDVWESGDHGKTWSEKTSHADWAARYGHVVTAMPDNSILLSGGSVGPQSNDSWRSVDRGASWVPFWKFNNTNSTFKWSARVGHAGVTLADGSVIVTGGAAGDGLKNDTWRFDPAGSRFQNPTHTYSAPNTYNVTLRAYNSQGFSTTQKRVTVSLLPFAALIAIAGACGIMRKRME